MKGEGAPTKKGLYYLIRPIADCSYSDLKFGTIAASGFIYELRLDPSILWVVAEPFLLSVCARGYQGAGTNLGTDMERYSAIFGVKIGPKDHSQSRLALNRVISRYFALFLSPRIVVYSSTQHKFMRSACLLCQESATMVLRCPWICSSFSADPLDT